MLGIFSKTEPRIKHDSRARNSRRERKLRAFSKKARDFSDHVAIARELDMVGGTAAHMHQHHRAFRARCELRHFRIVPERAYVVDYRSAGIECEPGDRGAPRID